MLRVDVGVGAVERDADDAIHSFDAAARQGLHRAKFVAIVPNL